MPEYNGKSPLLSVLAGYNISQETFDIIKVYGPARFLDLAKDSGNCGVYGAVWRQYKWWMKRCPYAVRAEIYEKYRKPMPDDNDEWIAIIARHITVGELSRWIQYNDKWYNEAPRLIRLLLEKIVYEEKMPCPVENADYCLIEEAFCDFIDETTRFLKYAGFLR